MSLKVTTEPRENRQLAMTIEVDQARVDQELRKAARKVAGRIRVPGFRKGRAPYNIVVRHVGVGALFEEFVDELGKEVFQEAIEQEGIEPYAAASLHNIETEPLRYELTIPLPPEVRIEGYRSLRVEEPSIEVTEEEIQQRLDELLDRQADYTEVDRPSQYGDLMTVDVRAVVLDEEGNETDQVVLDEEDWDVTPDLENPMEPASIDQELVGLTPGAEKTFEITWPAGSPSLYAGKTGRFHVVVHRIQAYQRPALTDEIAQTIGPAYESAEDLVESIRESIREERAEEVKSAYLETVLDRLVEMSELEYPPAALAQQIDRLVSNADLQARQMGLQGIEQYLQLMDQSMDEYRESLREEAERQLERGLVLGKIVESEQLRVSDEEFEERLERMLGEEAEGAEEEQKERRQQLRDQMRDQPTRAVIEEQILSEKAIERVLAIARGEELPDLETGLDAGTGQGAPAPAAESTEMETMATEPVAAGTETGPEAAPVVETVEESESSEA